MSPTESRAHVNSQELVLTVAANFTAEPIEESLRFWMRRLALGFPRLEFSGYNQVFQELMAPDSALAAPARGVNCLLIRPEDWGRDQDLDARAQAVGSAAREFVAALHAFAKRARRPTVLFLCPASCQAMEEAELRSVLEEADANIRRAAAGMNGVTLVTPEDVAQLYPVKVVDDPESERQAHIPFTRSYWAALGTMFARKAAALLRPPYKVIVLDADNTLWGGVVGEVGADRVRVDGPWATLHRFLRERKANGMLLALVTKNREEDVAEVLRRSDSVLRREDFVACKANWEPKSRNIRSLARELDLAEDSVIFLDDNPVECAEVAAHCPGVTTLILPPDSTMIPEFVRHVWAFDVAVVTATDEKRTELYREQSERNQFRVVAGGYREFIEGLQLQVSLTPPAPADYDRAAQLIQRTNQFNTSGIRRTRSELASLLESGERGALLVRARDRFGDYGEVGLGVFSVAGTTLTVDTFLMSCRVLGKGVEHRALAAFGREAMRLEATDISIPFAPTVRNQPAEKFLKAIGAQLLEDGAYHLTSSGAAAVAFDPEAADTYRSSEESLDEPASVASRPDFCGIASSLNSPDAIVRAVSRELQRARPTLPNGLVLPRNTDEARLAAIWEEVLHVVPVGVTDPFLSLGGQSLQAASIVGRIAAECGVRTPLSALLSNPTVADLALQLEALPRTHGTTLPEAGERVLSPAQRRLWFLDHFIPNRSAYNIPLGWRLRGPLDLGALELALTSVAERHELLRSTYSSDDESTVMGVSANARVVVHLASASSEAHGLTLAHEEARRPFDLVTGPVFRCLVVRLGASDHLLVLNVHHIVSDGWSMEVLARDIADAYAAAIAGQDPAWTPLPASYASYALWQRERKGDGDFQADLDYWTNELNGAPPLLELPSDMRRPSAMSYTGSVVSARLSTAARLAVESLAQREGCTTFTVMLAAWQTVLYRYTQQEDIVVGVPFAGRSHPLVEGVVGCFVNTLPIRTRVNADDSFLKHVQVVRGKMMAALAHQELPVEHLITELNLERDVSRSPLFQVVLVLQSGDADLPLEGLSVSPVHLHNGGAKFDLVLEVTPTADAYRVALEFDTSLFLPETAERALTHFVNVVEHACAAPAQSVGSLSMMAPDEVQRTLAFVNDEKAVRDDVECLHRAFERRAMLSPEAPAISFEGEVLSYCEVNQRANRIAHHLIAHGIGPDTLVGICLDRSADLVIAILGVLKAGGAYLPIDLSYPADRLAFMLDDARAPILLTEKKLCGFLPLHNARTICLDEPTETLSAEPVTNPVTKVEPDHMAYVIYTSGSTGKPKGCVITHRNVARLMRATEQWYRFDEQDVWTLFHSVAFDFSVWEIWGALLYGGRIVVVPFLVSRSPESFYRLLADEQVTVLNQTPSAFRQLIHAEESVGPKPLALRYVIFGGEALEMQSLQPWFERHGDQKPVLVNMYGITETTVHVTYRPLSKDDVRSASVIGVPIPDLQLYILDPRGEPVPIGIPGELYVGGAGLARGYLHRSALTAERFVPDTLSKQPGGRLYRTGDLARFLAGRDIEYLGRIDHQVKIRGFRIELGEIESVLCHHEAVREAVVIAREDVPGEKRLVAYTVTSQPEPEVSSLRDHLKVKLPEYMVPSAFVFVDKFPLTNNGKVDRRALPVPEQHRPELAERYVPPRTAAERTLAAIWSKALRLEQVGVHDNFFELGGDSILSIQIVSLARREGLSLTPTLLFANQTIADLAAVAGTGNEVPRVDATTLAGDVPLTPIQHWFFEQKLEEPHHYNQAFLLEVSERLERPLLERVLEEISRQHGCLRLRYDADKVTGGWRQFYSEDTASPLRWMDLGHLPEAEQRQSLDGSALSAQASLNLSDGPLWRVVYFDLGSARPGRLLLVVHHLAVDGISWRPLIEDLETGYRQVKAGEAIQLPSKTTSFKEWAEDLGTYARSQKLLDQAPFWAAVGQAGLAAREVAPSATNDALARNTEGSSRTITIALTFAETQSLLQDVPSAYNTQINDVLLTALAQAWNQSTGSRSLFTNLEGHGREDLFDDVDLSRTVGWFTSIFPVCLTLPSNADRDPGDALKSIKEQLRHIPLRGIGYGVLRYLSRDSDVCQVLEPSILFNYLGQFDQVISDSQLFRFASEPTGPWHSPSQLRRHALEVNSVVFGGRLEVTWTFSDNLHAEVAIRQLADGFLDALRTLIEHCVSPDAGGRTTSDFPLVRLEQSALDRLVSRRSDIEDIYPLSPIQTLFHSANPGALLSLFDHWECTLRGELNVAAFQQAWKETLRRHAILRSTIHSEGLTEPVQVVHRDVGPSWTIEDWRRTPATELAQRWNVFLNADRQKPLNLTEAPVMRFGLVRLADDEWKFLWSVPALLLDGWSWPLVFHDVSELYEASLLNNRSAQLAPARPYRDYLAWLGQQSSLGSHEFWRHELAGFREPTPLPSDTAGPAAGDRFLKEVTVLAEETTTALTATARGLQVTVSALVQGAWAIVLNRESGAADVTFGAAFAGRPSELRESESIVGPFVNNVPVRTAVNLDATTREFFRSLHARLLAVSPHQFVPLMEIQRHSEVPWRHRLFESVVVFQNYLVDESARRLGSQVEIADFKGPIHTNYAMMLLAEPGPALRLTFIYDQQRVARKAVERCARSLALVLQQLPDHLDRPLAMLQSLLAAPPVVGSTPRPRFRAESQNYLPPQTDMERAIATVWRRLFGMDEVGIDENFFELGGHSLMLVQMHTELRAAVNHDLSIVALFEHPTIRSLARYVDEPAAPTQQAAAQWRDRAQKHKQALTQMKIKLKREAK